MVRGRGVVIKDKDRGYKMVSWQSWGYGYGHDLPIC